jgi:hypothetical protein
MEEMTMPDWNNLRTAYKDGLPNAAQLRELQRLEKLLDLPPEQAKTALTNEIHSGPARDLYQNLRILDFAIQRAAGILPGPDSNEQLQKLAQEVQEGNASPGRAAAAKRLFIVRGAPGEVSENDPTVTQGPTAGEVEKEELRQASSAIFARLQSAPAQTGTGAVSRSVEQLPG